MSDTSKPTRQREEWTAPLDTDDLSPSQALSLGDASLVDERVDAALTAFTAGLATVRDSLTEFRLLHHRAVALEKMERDEEAMEDLQKATALIRRLAGLRPRETEVCYKRLGRVAYRCLEYATALSAFESANELAYLNHQDTALYHEWMLKCTEQLENYPAEPKPIILHTPTGAKDPEPIVLHTPTAASPAEPPAPRAASRPPRSVVPPKDKATPQSTESQPTVPQFAESQPTVPQSIVSQSTDEPKPKSAVVSAPKQHTTAADPIILHTPTAKPPTMPKYQYYQSDKFVTICILESRVQDEDLTISMETQHVSVRLDKSGTTFTVVHGRLYDTILLDLCKVNIKDDKVLIKLRKEQVGFEWPELFSKEKQHTPKPAVASEAPTTVPTIDDSKPRPYASHRDWNSIERNIEAEEATEKKEGDEAMNQLFQQIFKDADDDTRRAMVKSYQTSGGTVLSTNWDEVKDKDYEHERVAPKGMEWKTWEGDRL